MRMALRALDNRNKLLRYFYVADKVRCTVYRYPGIERATAAVMVSAMFGALGTKADESIIDEMIGGCIEVIEGDASAMGMWEPLKVTPATLASACRKLIATSKFVPKPVESAEACREAWYRMIISWNYCERLCEFVVECDAVLLEFAPMQWCEPYMLPEYESIGQRMLHLHSNNMDENEDFCIAVRDALWCYLSLNRGSDRITKKLSFAGG
jgi:hypothetical protein